MLEMHCWKTIGYEILGSDVSNVLQWDQRSVEKVRMKFISLSYLIFCGLFFLLLV
jgi:hypothetical protein